MNVRDSFQFFPVIIRVTSSPAASRSACLNRANLLSLVPAQSADFGVPAAIPGPELVASWSLQRFGANDGFRARRWLAGLAKFRFCPPTLLQAITPITAPPSLTSGPPLFPPEMG